MVQSVKDNLADLSGEVNQQMAVLRDDIAHLTANVATYAKAQGLQLKSAATQKASYIAKFGAKTAAVAKERPEVAYAEAQTAVRANPAAAVGIALGIGFLVGAITTRH